MDYLKNHCMIFDSIWGDHYNCQILVGLSKWRDHDKEDWTNLIITKDYYDKEIINGRQVCKSINTLKPEVLEWLHSNVPDYKGVKGWAVGSDEYTFHDSSTTYDIGFQRRRDAMAFIKRWSKWKKPVRYCQYFTDIRKELDLTTLKYRKV